MSDADREIDRRLALDAAPAQDLWVFAYGSLMWNPCFEAAERRRGSLKGYRRRFNFWTMVARGTRTRPGLGLGLEPDPAATCVGIAYRIGEARADQDSHALWKREMYSGVYRPTWVAVETDRGLVDAITFVLDPSHPQYAGELNRAERAAIIAAATGKYGPCHEYLASTIAHLAELGMREPDLDDLNARVQAIVQGA
jgi:cation transport protein ChaC